MVSETGTRREQPYLLSKTPPTRSQKFLAGGVLIVLVSALFVAIPFAQIRLTGTALLLPAYAASIFLVEIITAALLLGLFSASFSSAVLVLAIGYLFSGLMVVPWAVTFLGVFDVFGFEPGLQSTASIAAMRRLGFPLFVLAYALMKDRTNTRQTLQRSALRTILSSVACMLIVACSLTWLVLVHQDMLPQFMRTERDTADLWRYVPAASLVLYSLVLAILWARRQSVLDLWLMVVICTLMIEILLISYISVGVRLSSGWWAGRIYGLASASIVLLALLSETTTLHYRLARSVIAERRTREARLTAMEALSASIAHEINQPLASMVTNADAGLRWLAKKDPNIAETEEALKRIVNDGHRAGKVIETIRAMFKKEARENVPLDLNGLINGVLTRNRDEALLSRVKIEAELAKDIPPVSSSPVRLQQVVSNLIINAIDAVRPIANGRRVVHVASSLQPSGEVMISVGDCGIGLDPAHKRMIFEPFFTTKADGMGMGLMVCRSIIEAEGGRLWVTDNRPQGAIFHFTLPTIQNHDVSISESSR